jgi:formate hydrogenlyase subunit 6/NADH:ubiquinone oxidoreductase subunit I
MVKISTIFRKVGSLFFTNPVTTGDLFTKLQVQDNFRGQMQLDYKLCIGCGLCKRDCPGKAVEMVDFNGKKCPQFRLDKCLFCYQCAESCPKKAIKKSSIYELATTDKSTLVMRPKHDILYQA